MDGKQTNDHRLSPLINPFLDINRFSCLFSVSISARYHGPLRLFRFFSSSHDFTGSLYRFPRQWAFRQSTRIWWQNSSNISTLIYQKLDTHFAKQLRWKEYSQYFYTFIDHDLEKTWDFLKSKLPSGGFGGSVRWKIMKAGQQAGGG